MEILTKIIDSLISISAVPFIILNFLAGIVGGIWLLFLGEWRLELLGVLILFGAPFVYSIVLLPTLAFGAIGLHFLEKGNKVISGITLWINLVYTQFVILYWVLSVFIGSLNLTQGNNSLPYILLGYAIATGPFAYMASKEGPDSIASSIMVWLAQFTYVIASISWYLNLQHLVLPIVILVAVLLQVWQMKITFALQETEPYGER